MRDRLTLVGEGWGHGAKMHTFKNAGVARLIVSVALSAMACFPIVVGPEEAVARTRPNLLNLAPDTTVTPIASPTPSPTHKPAPTPTKTPTPTPRPRPTATPTRRPKPDPTSTPIPARRPKPTPTMLRPRPKSTASPSRDAIFRASLNRDVRAILSVAQIAVASATLKVSRHPAPGPPVQQNVINTISPVICNGKSYPAARPFLSQPFHGYVQLTSFFDHDYPDFTRDGLIVIANGMRAAMPARSVSRFGIASDFPAYWSGSVRQYVYYDGHNGYDYSLNYQPVYAAAAGRVLFAGWNYPGEPREGYGQMVLIDHGKGYVTLYGHFSRILVHSGEKLKAGQELGISGNTGHSSGPHLHFSVFHNCKPTDPYGWSGSGSDPLTSYQGETSAFLWLRPPDIVNLFPRWPGLTHMPAPPEAQVLNLTLPDRVNLVKTLSALNREQRAIAAVLRRHSIPVHYDWAAAAFLFPKPVKPALLYSVPYAASIVPDSSNDLFFSEATLGDFLARLVPRVKLGNQLVGGPWRTNILRFRGQTYLLGRGPANESLELIAHNSHSGPMSTVSNGRGRFVIPLSPALPKSDLEVISTSGKALLAPHVASEGPPQGRGSRMTGNSHKPSDSIGPEAGQGRDGDTSRHGTQMVYLYLALGATTGSALVLFLFLTSKRLRRFLPPYLDEDEPVTSVTNSRDDSPLS